MLKIAVCDDDLNFLEQEIRYIKAYGKSRRIALEVTGFHESRVILNNLEIGNGYHLFVLDVDMPEKSGLEVAKEIRKKYPQAVIIYLSNYADFAIDAYEVEATRYVEKSKMKEKLPSALDIAITKIQEQARKFLTVRSYHDMIKVFHDDIIYVQRILRKLQIATLRQGDIYDPRGLKELHKLIDDERFIFIDRSTFVNMDYIQQLERAEIVLLDGLRLAVSRQQLPKVKETISTVWGGL